MKRYLTRERVYWILALIFFVACLTGCKINYDRVIDSYKAEGDVFGWVLVWPMAWLMYQIGHLFNDSFAWGVIFTTIIVRTIAWPVYASTNNMSLKMQLAQPEINKLQQKYALKKDPESQQKMQMEMMAIYKKHKINFLGCLMPIIQMPLFMAMYTVVKRITVTKTDELGVVTHGKLYLGNQNFLGIDLSKGVYGAGAATPWVTWTFWGGIILALIVGGTMFLSTWVAQKKPSYMKNTPTAPVATKNGQPDMSKSMKWMNYFMVVMMVVIALQNNGLALYWVIGNVYSLGQQLINRRLNEKKYYKLKKETIV